MNRYLLPVLAVVAGCWFIGSLVYAAFHADLGFDPAYHAALAKNFAMHGEWATPYDRHFPFNPDITTGPAMLLPMAVLIKLFGNPLWLPALCTALLSLSVTGLCLWRLYGFGINRSLFAVLVITLSVVLAVYEGSWWLLLKGDYLAALLALLSQILLLEPRIESAAKRTALSGLVLALSLQAKLLAAFVLPVILLYLLCTVRRNGSKVLLIFMVSLVAAMLPWQLYQKLELSSEPAELQQERAEYREHFLSAQGSGLNELLNSDSLFEHLQSNVERNGEHWLSFHQKRYGMSPLVMYSLLLALAVVLIWQLLRSCRADDAWGHLLLLMAVTATVHYLWFFFVSASWNAKYALGANLFLLFTLVFSAIRVRHGVPLLAGVVLLVLLLPQAGQQQLQQRFLFQQQTSDYKKDLQAVIEYLQQEHDSTVPLAGCGWVFAPWVVEYGISQSGNFVDCRRLIREGLAAEGNGWRWKQPVEFALVANHIYWQTSAYRSRYQLIPDACGQQPLFRSNYFSVLHCTAQSLQQALPLQRVNSYNAEFIPADTQYYYVHKPAALPLSR